MKRTRTHIKFLPSYSLPIKVPTLAFLLLSLFYFLPFAAGRDCSPEQGVPLEAPCERTTPKESAQAVELLGKSPAVFIENQGQWEDDSVHFAMRRPGANVLIYDDTLAIQLVKRHDNNTPSATIKMRFMGANRVPPVGIERSESVFHYYRGPNEQRRSNVQAFQNVVYRDLYDGIDLLLKARHEGLKLEFRIAPGSDWRKIAVTYEGIDSLLIDDEGQLAIATPIGTLIDAAPVIYQEIRDKRISVEGRFRLIDSKTCGFELMGTYDSAYPLIIDPDLVWSTYLGGRLTDYCFDMALDGSGNLCITGLTGSDDFPMANAWDASYNGKNDIFLSKFTADGSQLIWSTYLGGSEYENGYGIAVDVSGNIYVTGRTYSSDLPTPNGWDTTYNGGFFDAFVSKFSSDGQQLLWSTYLGGSDWDEGQGIAVDVSGNVYVVGYTKSSDFPTSNGWDTSFNGIIDSFVSRFSSDGSLVWSTYLGGSVGEYGHAIAVDASGDAYVTGTTDSADFPTSNSWDTSFNGDKDIFLTKFSADGSQLLWSTYLGGAGQDWCYGIAVDDSGNIFVTGHTWSVDFPTPNGWDTSYNGGLYDIVVSKFSSDGQQLLWSTYLGGNDRDEGYGIVVDRASNVYITGFTASSDFPTPNGWDTSYNDPYPDQADAFLSKFSADGSELLWSTYLGGKSYDHGWAIVVDSLGYVYASGWTDSDNFPVPNGWDTSRDPVSVDVFVSKFVDWPILFDFIPDPQEWSSGGAPGVFSIPDFAWEPDYLKITSTTNTDTFGYWVSPQDAVAVEPDHLYRARFNVSTDITNQALVPQIRLRVNSLNLQQYDVLSIESAGEGGASPATAGTDHDLYFVLPANDTAVMLAFDLLNFNPDDAAAAELSLDTVAVDCFALESLSTSTIVKDYTFNLTTDGWTQGGAGGVFSLPDCIYSAGALELRATTNTSTFGYWVNDPVDITIEANRLYRGTFEVRTDVTNRAMVPQMRLRFNTGNFQASHMLGINSAGDGANSPGTTNTTYDRLYFLPPANCAGEDLIVSFDILNFDPNDAAEASLILDRAIIETLPLPALP